MRQFVVTGDYADPNMFMHYAIRLFRDKTYTEGYTLQLTEMGDQLAKKRAQAPQVLTVEIEIDQLTNRSTPGDAIIVTGHAINDNNRLIQLFIHNDRVEAKY